jgi:hypothetical protein
MVTWMNGWHLILVQHLIHLYIMLLALLVCIPFSFVSPILHHLLINRAAYSTDPFYVRKAKRRQRIGYPPLTPSRSLHQEHVTSLIHQLWTDFVPLFDPLLRTAIDTHAPASSGNATAPSTPSVGLRPVASTTALNSDSASSIAAMSASPKHARITTTSTPSGGNHVTSSLSSNHRSSHQSLSSGVHHSLQTPLPPLPSSSSSMSVFLDPIGGGGVRQKQHEHRDTYDGSGHTFMDDDVFHSLFDDSIAAPNNGHNNRMDDHTGGGNGMLAGIMDDDEEDGGGMLIGLEPVYPRLNTLNLGSGPDHNENDIDYNTDDDNDDTYHHHNIATGMASSMPWTPAMTQSAAATASARTRMTTKPTGCAGGGRSSNASASISMTESASGMLAVVGRSAHSSSSVSIVDNSKDSESHDDEIIASDGAPMTHSNSSASVPLSSHQLHLDLRSLVVPSSHHTVTNASASGGISSSRSSDGSSSRRRHSDSATVGAVGSLLPTALTSVDLNSTTIISAPSSSTLVIGSNNTTKSDKSSVSISAMSSADTNDAVNSGKLSARSLHSISAPLAHIVHHQHSSSVSSVNNQSHISSLSLSSSTSASSASSSTSVSLPLVRPQTTQLPRRLGSPSHTSTTTTTTAPPAAPTVRQARAAGGAVGYGGHVYGRGERWGTVANHSTTGAIGVYTRDQSTTNTQSPIVSAAATTSLTQSTSVRRLGRHTLTHGSNIPLMAGVRGIRAHLDLRGAAVVSNNSSNNNNNNTSMVGPAASMRVNERESARDVAHNTNGYGHAMVHPHPGSNYHAHISHRDGRDSARGNSNNTNNTDRDSSTNSRAGIIDMERATVVAAIGGSIRNTNVSSTRPVRPRSSTFGLSSSGYGHHRGMSPNTRASYNSHIDTWAPTKAKPIIGAANNNNSTSSSGNHGTRGSTSSTAGNTYRAKVTASGLAPDHRSPTSTVSILPAVHGMGVTNNSSNPAGTGSVTTDSTSSIQSTSTVRRSSLTLQRHISMSSSMTSLNNGSPPRSTDTKELSPNHTSSNSHTHTSHKDDSHVNGINSGSGITRTSKRFPSSGDRASLMPIDLITSMTTNSSSTTPLHSSRHTNATSNNNVITSSSSMSAADTTSNVNVVPSSSHQGGIGSRSPDSRRNTRVLPSSLPIHNNVMNQNIIDATRNKLPVIRV